MREDLVGRRVEPGSSCAGLLGKPAEAVDHLVEALGQAPELVAPEALGLVGEVAFAYALRQRHEPRQWP
jgi:hypothetical protein